MDETSLVTPPHPLARLPYRHDLSDPCDRGEDDHHHPRAEQVTPFPDLPTTPDPQYGWTLPVVVTCASVLALVVALSVFAAVALCAMLLADALVALYRTKRWSYTCESRAVVLASEIERRLLADAPQARVMFDMDDAVAHHIEKDRPQSVTQTLWNACVANPSDDGRAMELYVMTSAEGDAAVYTGAQVRRAWTRLFEAPHGRGLWGSAFCGRAQYHLAPVVLFRAVKHMDDLYDFLGIGKEPNRVRHHFHLRQEAKQAVWRRRDAAKRAALQKERALRGPPRPPTLFSRPP
ncbi:hypothetical protein pkur_cds_37 [Pandoravirus kuranda]|uniref:Uncharacterized protein n=1 Tax=Pandoravirus kuranda TaxID=3019033 RepID=A0AA95ECH7_9VIRU|nr:hypothetical protein pkur_cds_37 [Pandoravirus kuranda]